MLAPKASKWDAFVNSEGLISMTELAGALHTSAVKMTEWFIEMKWFHKLPSQQGGGRMPRVGVLRSLDFDIKHETRNGRTFADMVFDAWTKQQAA